VHWLAYAAYPVTVAHSLGAGKDLRSGWLLALTVATVLAVVAALCARLTGGYVASPRHRRVPEQLARAANPGSLR
jgi:sulfoxide reductase heme-binding subunit YedZ